MRFFEWLTGARRMKLCGRCAAAYRAEGRRKIEKIRSKPDWKITCDSCGRRRYGAEYRLGRPEKSNRRDRPLARGPADCLKECVSNDYTALIIAPRVAEIKQFLKKSRPGVSAVHAFAGTGIIERRSR